MNPAMEHMLGQSQKQLAGLHITELFKDLDKAALERVLSEKWKTIRHLPAPNPIPRYW